MKKLEVLRRLIEIRSDEDSKMILNYIEEKLKEKVEEIIYVENKENNKSNMIVGINTKLSDVEPIVMSGHIDTVNPDINYTSDPYKLIIKEDKAYGLGVIDMKCFTSSIIDMIDDIKEVDCPLVLSLTCDEETDFYGINNVVNKFKELNIRPKFTIVGEPTSFEIKNVSNGCFEYQVKVYGKGCHSSTPKLGINAICVISRIVTFIEELSYKYDDLTMSCDLIEGGSIINRVAEYASMSFDIRTDNICNYNEVISLINKEITRLKEFYKCEIKLENKIKIPPLNCKDINKINILSEKLSLNVGKFTGGCEAGYYSEYSGESILFGLGDLSLAHKPNEYMVVDDYEKYNKKLKDMITIIKDLYY